MWYLIYILLSLGLAYATFRSGYRLGAKDMINYINEQDDITD